MLKLAKTEACGRTGYGVAFAGLEKLIAQGTVRKDQLVVVNCTGHTSGGKACIGRTVGGGCTPER